MNRTEYLQVLLAHQASLLEEARTRELGHLSTYHHDMDTMLKQLHVRIQNQYDVLESDLVTYEEKVAV